VKDFQGGLIVMGDLTRWKIQSFFEWSYCNGRSAQVKKYDLPGERIWLEMS